MSISDYGISFDFIRTSMSPVRTSMAPGWRITPELSILRLGQCRDAAPPGKRGAWGGGKKDSAVKHAHAWAWQRCLSPREEGCGVRRTPGSRVLRLGSSRDG